MLLLLLLTDTKIFSHVNGQELNSTNDGTMNINELISKLENNITKLENNITNLTRRLGILEQSLTQGISELHQRIDGLLGYASCIADATENNFRISEQCPLLNDEG